jgi:hypothetical protein
MLQSNEPNIFAREIFCGISFVGTGLKKKRETPKAPYP